MPTPTPTPTPTPIPIGSCTLEIVDPGTATPPAASEQSHLSITGDRRVVAQWMIELGIDVLASEGADEDEIDFILTQAKELMLKGGSY